MMDTNPRQFERQGNPWHGDGKISRSKRIRLGLTRPGLPRRPERHCREASEAMADFRCKQKIEALVAAVNGNGRAVAKPEPKPALINFVNPARNSELTHKQLELRDIQRAEVRARCERISREEEREKLRATIAAATRRLGDLMD